MAGDLSAAQFVRDGAEGRPQQSLQIDNKPEKPIEELRAEVEHRLNLLGWTPPKPKEEGEAQPD